MSKLYEKAVEKAKEEMSDELFLGFYKKGQITSGNFENLEDAQIHYSAILDMKKDKSFGECEAAYSNGIEKIADVIFKLEARKAVGEEMNVLEKIALQILINSH